MYDWDVVSISSLIFANYNFTLRTYHTTESKSFLWIILPYHRFNDNKLLTYHIIRNESQAHIKHLPNLIQILDTKRTPS